MLNTPGYVVVLLFAVTGCTALLPNSETRAKSEWTSFQSARERFDRIVAYQTGKEDLIEYGFNPWTNPNIAVLTYSDVIRRFVPSGAISTDNLDRGIKDCIAAKDACSAYEVEVKEIKRKRSGNFWLDALNFKRHTDVSGWRFNGLIVMRDDVVVYKLWGGQPLIQEAEDNRNPLGPLQGAVESAARRIGP